jgi:DHA1 family bicyclomycin/chloramphenicol resistance-like MFS transporter
MKLFAIVFTLFVACAEIDICIPSFPEIKELFNLSAFKTEMILTINLLCHCIGAIVVGGLGDKYGKKKIITIGLSIFILGSVICSFANSFESLIIGRMLQGFGVSAPMVLMIIFIFDIFPKEKQVGIVTMTNGVTTIAVCFAPIVGSYIDYWFDWHMNFIVLLILGIISMVLHLCFIPNDDLNLLKKKSSRDNYLTVFKDKVTLLYILAVCTSAGAYYTFVGMAPIIYMQNLGVDLKNFGFYQTSLTLAFGFFSMIIARVCGIIGNRACTIISIAFIATFIIFNSVFIFFGVSNPMTITIAMLFLSIGFVYPGNTLYAVAMQRDEENKGKISGMMTVVKWFITIIGVQMASYFYDDSFQSTSITIAVLVFISIIIIVKLAFSDRDLNSILLKK